MILACVLQRLGYYLIIRKGGDVDEQSMIRYISETFTGIEILENDGTTFIYYNPDRDPGYDHMFPFATLVTNNLNDTASDLNRPAVYRLNIGVSRETYRSMFGAPPVFRTDGGFAETGHDFTALDQIMPHPVYAAMSWICVLNPDATTDEVKTLLEEAYGMAVEKYGQKAVRQEPS